MKVTKEKFFSMLENNRVKSFKIGDKKFYTEDIPDNLSVLKTIDSKNYLFEKLKSDKSLESIKESSTYSMGYAKDIFKQFHSVLMSELEKGRWGSFIFYKVSRSDGVPELIGDSKNTRDLLKSYLKTISANDLLCSQWLPPKYGGGLTTCFMHKTERIIPRIHISISTIKGLIVNNGTIKIYLPVDIDTYIYLDLKIGVNNKSEGFKEILAKFAAQFLLMKSAQIKL